MGEWAIALGNPFGLFEAAEPTVTVGVVSAIGRDFPAQQGRTFRDMIQTDAAINSGNSGGPLVDAAGRVIGMNTFIYSRSGGSVGLGFAVPAWRIQRVVDELRETGSVDRYFYTGFDVRPVTARVARAIGLSAGARPHRRVGRRPQPGRERRPPPVRHHRSHRRRAGLDVSDVRSYVRDQLIDNRIGDTIGSASSATARRSTST